MALDLDRAAGAPRIPASRQRRHRPEDVPAQIAPSPRVRLQNVDHLALNTTDMKKTIAFYTQVLELPLVHVTRTPPDLEKARAAGAPPFPSLRHYFFDMGSGGLLGFFEYPPGTPRASRDSDATMQHVAFYASRADQERARQQLDRHGVKYALVKGGTRWWSLYFYDPNGIRLEITADQAHDDCDRLESVLQTEARVREELRTLYDSEEEIDRLIADMPLLVED
jgi:catechol 2,3-dioxygenase-like lactoylglutathione lyase family enzyme